jgi:hypothetical protein
MTMPSQRVHTDGIIAALVAAGLTVGDAEKPEDAEVPYAVVYPIPGGRTTGTLAAKDDDVVLVYQVTCVGESRKQAEWAADKARALLTPGSVSVTGRKVLTVYLDFNGGVERDDDVAPALFYCAPRFRITTTPA